MWHGGAIEWGSILPFLHKDMTILHFCSCFLEHIPNMVVPQCQFTDAISKGGCVLTEQGGEEP